MNQTKNYSATKWVSLIVDYLMVLVALQFQAGTTHYLVAAGLAVGYLQLNLMRFPEQCSERQQLLLAAIEVHCEKNDSRYIENST